METCCIFSYNTVDEALKPGIFEEVEDFGGEGEGYSWSDGHMELCRCKNCGALFLSYRMNFLAMTYDSDDKRFSAYLPVASHDEALEYVDKYRLYDAKDRYIGSLIAKDSQYKGKIIWFDGSKWRWNK